MPTISSFEDIAAWQAARELWKLTHDATSKREFNQDLRLRDQMRAAAASVASNIAEGFGRGGDKEFHQFLSVAKGSVNELKAQLYLAVDAGYITEPEFQHLKNVAVSVDRLIAGFMRYLRNAGKRGPKFI